jgi:polyisoprenoid-binding protein YceI
MTRWTPIAAAALLATAVPRPAHAQPLAPSNLYSLNQASGEVGFTIVARMLLTQKREGRFTEFSGELAYDPARVTDTHMDLTVFTSSVNMHNADHERVLRSPDFFDVERFPTMHFVSSGVSVGANGSLALDGDLTIRGITKHVTLPVRLSGNQRGGIVPAFETTFQIDRTEFGLNGTPTWGGVNVSIAKNVQIHVAIGMPPVAAGRRR